MTSMMLPARLLPALLLVVALVLLVCGARLSVAGVAAYQAEAFMTHWSAQAQERARAQQSLQAPDAAAWQVADAAARRAVAAFPVASGEYLDRLGRVQAWQQFTQPPRSTVALASRHAALSIYREAVQARPTWPNSYARLAHTKLLLAETDTEFEAALAAADALGRHRLSVNAEIAEITLAGWLWLDEVQRQRGEQHALRLLQHGWSGEQELLALGQRYGLPTAVCAATRANAAFRRLCQ